MDPAFATFIARLFQNSFSSEVVKQNFKLAHDHKKENLVRLINRLVGKKAMSEFMDSKGMNVFNATSMCSSLMLKLSKG
jgi:hypothetical protein